MQKNEISFHSGFSFTQLGGYYEPAVNLLKDSWNFSEKQSISTTDFKIFCYKSIVESIKSFLLGKYSDFDAHTTSNCCHGVAVLARDLISSLMGFEFQLEVLLKEGQKVLDYLQSDSCVESDFINWCVPNKLLDLARLYILSIVIQIDAQKGPITVRGRLKSIWPMSAKFFNKIVAFLQKNLSNEVAEKYGRYLDEIPAGLTINGISIEVWGKYIQPNYCRSDYRGINYVPNVFSMQICLAYLIVKKSVIAIINDLKDEDDIEKVQGVCFFEGNGVDAFNILEINDLGKLTNCPVVVFQGFCKLKNPSCAIFFREIQSWINQIPYLILACDVFYPHFPRVKDDPCFDNRPVEPEEISLKNLWDRCREIPGVCLSDPSFFCLSHIYVESFKNICSSKNVRYSDDFSLPKELIALGSN